jgi:hypothetical protein
MLTPVIRLILLPATSSFFPEIRIHAQRNPSFVVRRGKSKNDRAPKQSYRKCRTLHEEEFAESGKKDGKGEGNEAGNNLRHAKRG